MDSSLASQMTHSSSPSLIFHLSASMAQSSPASNHHHLQTQTVTNEQATSTMTEKVSFEALMDDACARYIEQLPLDCGMLIFVEHCTRTARFTKEGDGTDGWQYGVWNMTYHPSIYIYRHDVTHHVCCSTDYVPPHHIKHTIVALWRINGMVEPFPLPTCYAKRLTSILRSPYWSKANGDDFLVTLLHLPRRRARWRHQQQQQHDEQVHPQNNQPAWNNQQERQMHPHVVARLIYYVSDWTFVDFRVGDPVRFSTGDGQITLAALCVREACPNDDNSPSMYLIKSTDRQLLLVTRDQLLQSFHPLAIRGSIFHQLSEDM